MKARLSSLPPWPIHTSLSIVRPRAGEDFTSLFPTHKAWSLQSVLASKPLACVLMFFLHTHDHLYSHLFNTQIVFLQPLVSTAAKAISSRSWLVRALCFTEPLTTASAHLHHRCLVFTFEGLHISHVAAFGRMKLGTCVCHPMGLFLMRLPRAWPSLHSAPCVCYPWA